MKWFLFRLARWYIEKCGFKIHEPTYKYVVTYLDKNGKTIPMTDLK